MSIFATNKSAGQADALVKFALPLMGADGRIPYAEVEKHFGWGPSEDGESYNGIQYSRGWLIIRRAWLEAHEPTAIVDIAGLEQKAAKRFGRNYSFYQHVMTPVVVELRDKLQLSWGEIAVRTGRPESFCRKAYKKAAGKKDLGLRIGKGGRFAYDDPTLYQDNRSSEGAHIPVDLKRKPKPEELLNYKRKGQPEAPAEEKPAS